MRRTALVTLAATFAVGACQDATTSPQKIADLQTSEDRFSNPPPPPIEATATVSVGTQTFFAPLSGIITQSHCQALTENFFVIPATYLFNPVQNAGYVHFQNDEDEELTASANGMVKQQGDNDPIGQGTLTFLVDGCELVIHLDSVSEAVFGDCDVSPPPSVDLLLAPEDNPDQGCFHLEFDTVTFDGQPVFGGATIEGTPADDDPPIDIIG